MATSRPLKAFFLSRAKAVRAPTRNPTRWTSWAIQVAFDHIKAATSIDNIRTPTSTEGRGTTRRSVDLKGINKKRTVRRPKTPPEMPTRGKFDDGLRRVWTTPPENAEAYKAIAVYFDPISGSMTLPTAQRAKQLASRWDQSAWRNM